MPLTTREVPYLQCDGLGCGSGDLRNPNDPQPIPYQWMWYRGTNMDDDPDKFYCFECAKRMMNPAIPGGRRTHEPQLDPSELSTVPGLTVR